MDAKPVPNIGALILMKKCPLFGLNAPTAMGMEQ